MHSPEADGEKFRYRFLDFLFRWWSIFSSLLCAGIGIGSFFLLSAIFGSATAVVFWSSILITIVALILASVVFFKYRKWRYGVGLGEGDIDEPETFAKYPKKRKNFAKHQPDTLSEEAIDKALIKINKKRKKK